MSIVIHDDQLQSNLFMSNFNVKIFFQDNQNHLVETGLKPVTIFFKIKVCNK